MANFYVVATPIGNLDDITYRAIKTLQEVDYIACEDTRHTGKLLQHYGIKKPLLACHAHNERSSASGIVKLLDSGSNIAYCSDAGTPSISDPGQRLVNTLLETNHTIVPIPGASAFSTLVCVAGLVEEGVFFEGFLPQKGQKRVSRLQELLNLHKAFVIYESPYRIEKLLEELNSLGGDREIVVGREMTKKFEEFWRGSVSDVFASIKSRKIQGEFAIYISSIEKSKKV